MDIEEVNSKPESSSSQPELVEEDCDIVDIEIPPPMKIQEHSYQAIMSSKSESIGDKENVSLFFPIL